MANSGSNSHTGCDEPIHPREPIVTVISRFLPKLLELVRADGLLVGDR